MSITISSEIYSTVTPENNSELKLNPLEKLSGSKPSLNTINFKTENHNSGAVDQLESDYKGSHLNHELFIHPVAELFMNEIYPNENITSFTYSGESFVHGFQDAAFYDTDKLDKSGAYPKERILNYLKVNCKNILPMSVQDIKKIVEFYCCGYFSGKEYLANGSSSVAKLRGDLNILQKDLQSTTKSLLPSKHINDVKYGLTYLTIPELKFIDKEKIRLQTKKTVLKSTVNIWLSYLKQSIRD
jgi:hypothetical protein